MYAAGESPMKAVTSSVTAAMRSPKVVLMVFRRPMFSLDTLLICGRQFSVCIIRLIVAKFRTPLSTVSNGRRSN
jgi:hypothetical protein